MKKRLLSLVLCLVMVFSLLPMGSLAVTRYGPGYVEIPNNTTWTPTSDYAGYQAMSDGSGAGKIFYKDTDGTYYEVQFDRGNVYDQVAIGWYAHQVESYSQTLYSKSGTSYTATSTSREDWWQNLGDSVRIYGNFTRNANTLGKTWDLVSARETDGRIDNTHNPIYTVTFKANGEPFYHKVYSSHIGETGVGYYVTLYYFNATESMPSKGLKQDKYAYWYTPLDKRYDYAQAESDGFITVMGNGVDGYGWTWGGGDWTGQGAYYTHGDLYIPKGQASHANKLMAGSTVLAWPHPGSQNSEFYDGPLYTLDNNGITNLYYMKNGVRTYLPNSTAANETTDAIWEGKLYYFSEHAELDAPDEEIISIETSTDDDGVHTDKTLTKRGDVFDVTLTAYTTGNKVVTSVETQKPKVDPMDIVLVIDQSGSMATQDMGEGYDDGTTQDWTVAQATGGVTRYVKVGSNYYPVQAASDYVYEETENSVIASDLLNWGDDAITLGVNGAPTFYNVKTDYYVPYDGDGDGKVEMHRLFLITAGLAGNYGLYPYIYTNNNDGYVNTAKWEGHNYWVVVFDPWDGSDLRDNDKWNTLASNGRIRFVKGDGTTLDSSDASADAVKQSYQWLRNSGEDEWLGGGQGVKMTGLYQLSAKKAANELYYVDNGGVRHSLGKSIFADGTVWNGTLYTANSTSRTQALQTAVTQFLNNVQQSAVTDPAHPVNHRVAIVGFAGNEVPGDYSGTTAYNTTKYDYTNTGLFLNNGFKNYLKISSLKSPSTIYNNVHYFVQDSANSRDQGTGLPTANYVPVLASGSNWYKLGTKTQASTSQFREAVYENGDAGISLTHEDYNAAMVPVNANDAGDDDLFNDKLSNAIANFSAYGGTYTSYGMTMAEQIFKNLDAEATTPTDSTGAPAARQKFIIVFTDGEPGANGYDNAIAAEALASGNAAKLDGVTVYTVGLFKSAASGEVTDFMKKLSSEYNSVQLTPVNASATSTAATNHGLGNLDASKTYYYQDASTGKFYAVSATRNGSSTLGWWIHNNSRNGGITSSYSQTTPKASSGGGTTVFYNASGRQVQRDFDTNTVYYTANGDKIVYEYRWYDSDGYVTNPSPAASDLKNTQFYELTGAQPNASGDSYYMTAANANELNGVFEQIAGMLIQEETTVENGSYYTDETLSLMDEISEDFDLTENTTIKVYRDMANWDNDHNVSFTDSNVEVQGTLEQVQNRVKEAVVTQNGKRITVQYFDWGRYYVREGNENASRIRVVISDLVPNKPGTLYSNTAQSGMYYTDENDSSSLLEPFPRPTAIIPGYTVTWVNEQGTNMDNPYDQDTELMKGNFPVYDGEVPTKEQDVSNAGITTYKFDGWTTQKNSDDIAVPAIYTTDPDTGESQLTSTGNFPAVVDSNVTYYAHFAETFSAYYTATWYNGEANINNQLYKQEKLINGDVPMYNGDLPSKAADDTYTYFFAGWYDEDAYTRNGENYEAADVITQLPAIDGANVVYHAVFAPIEITTETYVLEYSTKNELVSSGVTGFDAIYTPGGEFSMAEGKLFFTPLFGGNKQYQTDGAVVDFTGFSVVNSGVYYTDNSTTKVNVIPSYSVYFDDSVTDVTSNVVNQSAAEKTFNYVAALNDEDVNTTAEQIEGGSRLTLTFTGSGIEVYAHTNANSGKVGAYLYNSEGKIVKSQIMNNNSENIDLYNVPTIRFDVDYGTYKLLIIPNKSADYRLDGVRVFNPSTEKTAKYLNIRGQLLDQYKENQDVFGALFLVGNTSEASVSTYEKYGPKNEVYLDAGESVTFQVKGWTGGSYRVGLSAVSGGTINAAVSNGDNTTQPIAYTVEGKTHVFYTVKPADDGSVMIKNNNQTKGAILSITDLEIVGGEAAAIVEPELSTEAVQGPKLAATRSLMSYARSFDADAAQPLPEVETPQATAEPSPSVEPTPSAEPSNPTPTPTAAPSVQSIVRQLISSFVNALFNSVSRLFGGH